MNARGRTSRVVPELNYVLYGIVSYWSITRRTLFWFARPENTIKMQAEYSKRRSGCRRRSKGCGFALQVKLAAAAADRTSEVKNEHHQWQLYKDKLAQIQ